MFKGCVLLTTAARGVGGKTDSCVWSWPPESLSSWPFKTYSTLSVRLSQTSASLYLILFIPVMSNSLGRKSTRSNLRAWTNALDVNKRENRELNDKNKPRERSYGGVDIVGDIVTCQTILRCLVYKTWRVSNMGNSAQETLLDGTAQARKELLFKTSVGQTKPIISLAIDNKISHLYCWCWNACFVDCRKLH